MASEDAFNKYKETEKLALKIAGDLQASGAKTADIEIALITAIFVMHKGKLLPHRIANIIKSHTDTLVSYFPQSDTRN
jgi:hypothetical protein